MLKRKSTSFALLPILAAWDLLLFMTSNRFDKQIDAWVAAEKKSETQLRSTKAAWRIAVLRIAQLYGVRWSDRKGASAISKPDIAIARGAGVR
jgi:hypothetical protein